jgi:hypothetical protein
MTPFALKLVNWKLDVGVVDLGDVNPGTRNWKKELKG